MRLSALLGNRALRSTLGLLLVLVTVLSLVGVAAAEEKGTTRNVGAQETGSVVIDGNPLQIIVAKDGSAQVVYKYTDVPASGQFYPSSQTLADQGMFLWLNNQVYGPDFANHPTSAYDCSPSFPQPFTEISQSGPTGSGSASSPWVVTTTVGAGSIQIVENISYVNGQKYARWDAQIRNTSEGSTTLTYFHAGDIYLKGSDSGFPYYNSATGGVGGQNEARDWFVVFQPITAATRYQEADYCTIWQKIGGVGAPGAGFDNTIAGDTSIDNGAGLQWSNLSIGAGQSTTVSDYLAFTNVASEIPTPVPTGSVVPTPTGSAVPTATRTPRPPEVPEPGSLALLASGLLGLGGYLGFRVRNLRK